MVILSNAERERLALLVEECGEAIAVAGKALRHGLASSDLTGQVVGTNATLLQCELGDVLAAVELLTTSSNLFRGAIETASVQKLKRLRKWLHEDENLKLVELLLMQRGESR